MKGIQYFSKEYLKRCEGATPDQIIEFLENYRMLFSNTRKKKEYFTTRFASSLESTKVTEEEIL